MPIAAVAAAAVSLGLGAATAAGAFDPDKVPEPSYIKTAKEAMEVEEALAPRRLALSQEFSPQYQAIQQRMTEQALFGSENSPGMLALAEKAEPRMSALTAAAQRASRESAIRDVTELGPSAMAALRSWDPAMTGLSDQLMGQASTELAAGGKLTASERTAALRDIRGGQAARGMGYGGGDLYMEALGMGQAAEARKRGRQAFAQGVLSQRAALVGDPYTRVLGSGSGAVNALGTVGSAYGGSTLWQAQPQTGIAAEMAIAGYKGEIAQTLEAWKARMEAMQGLGSSTGNFLGAMGNMKGFGGNQSWWGS